MLTWYCVKNPNEQLEQLRRSSLVEFEHLKKDEHPNPPLRALPEHSVLEDEAESSGAPQSGGKEQEKGSGGQTATSTAPGSSQTDVGRVSTGVSTDDQLKGQQTAIREIVGDEPQQQPPAPLLDTVTTPEAQGISGQDFASLMPEGKKETTTTAQQAPLSKKGFFQNPFPDTFAPRDRSPAKLPKSTEAQSSELLPSSTYSQTSESTTIQTPPSSAGSQHASAAPGDTITAGKAMFVVPNFEASAANVDDDDIISPTNTRTG